MSPRASHISTKKKLFASLRVDGISVPEYILNLANSNDGEALYHIGNIYYTKKGDKDKAAGWFHLSESQNYVKAQFMLGILYSNGINSREEYNLGNEYFLKAAEKKDDESMKNIGYHFEKGIGLPIDNYKALEWYFKCRDRLSLVKKFYEAGIFLTREDENKTLGQLICEVREIMRVARKKKNALLKTGIQKLDQFEDQTINPHNKIERPQIKSQQNQRRINLIKKEKQNALKELRLLKKSNNNIEKQLKNGKKVMDSLKRKSRTNQQNWSAQVEQLRTLIRSKEKNITSLEREHTQLLSKNQRHINVDKEFKHQKKENQTHTQGSMINTIGKNIRTATNNNNSRIFHTDTLSNDRGHVKVKSESDVIVKLESDDIVKLESDDIVKSESDDIVKLESDFKVNAPCKKRKMTHYMEDNV